MITRKTCKCEEFASTERESSRRGALILNEKARRVGRCAQKTEEKLMAPDGVPL